MVRKLSRTTSGGRAPLLNTTNTHSRSTSTLKQPPAKKLRRGVPQPTNLAGGRATSTNPPTLSRSSGDSSSEDRSEPDTDLSSNYEEEQEDEEDDGEDDEEESDDPLSSNVGPSRIATRGHPSLKNTTTTNKNRGMKRKRPDHSHGSSSAGAGRKGSSVLVVVGENGSRRTPVIKRTKGKGKAVVAPVQHVGIRRSTSGISSRRDESSDLDEDDEEDEAEDPVEDEYTPRRGSGYDLIAPSDDNLISQATSPQLRRLRKNELLRLWRVAGLFDEDVHVEDEMTKGELVKGLIQSRTAPSMISSPSRPRSSASTSSTSSHAPRGPVQRRGRARPSEPTSMEEEDEDEDEEGGNEGGGEETDEDGDHIPLFPSNARNRRQLPAAALHPARGRREFNKKLGAVGSIKAAEERRARFGADIPSPAVHHHQPSSMRRRSSVTSQTSTPPKTRSRSRTRNLSPTTSDAASVPRPRRLRTRGAGRRQPTGRRAILDSEEVSDDDGEEDAIMDSGEEAEEGGEARRPVTRGFHRSALPQSPFASVDNIKRVPMARKVSGGSRKGKEKANDEEAMDVADDAAEFTESQDELILGPPYTTSLVQRTNSQLANTKPPSSPPVPIRQLRRRKNSGHDGQPVQIPTPPSDGDDESSSEEEDDNKVLIKPQAAIAALGRRTTRRVASLNKDTPTIRVSKASTIASEDNEVEEDEDVSMHGDSDADAVGESEETTDDDIDLENATQATLIRLRRDELVHLCSVRDLDVVGTKPQLVQALIEWRDGTEQYKDDDDSDSDYQDPDASQSSQSTAKPISHKRLHEGDPAFTQNVHPTPVLLRADRIENSPPQAVPQAATPPPSQHAGAAANEELSLDLESLGLEDREIPVDRLNKMEKIGSGGFKDVYVGKYRGRQKCAIAEFRGQLSEMDIKELKLLADFDHPNVVRFLGVCIPEDKRQPIMMVSELCENGDLFDYIRNVPCPPLKTVLKIMLDIAKGLAYLHSLKPAVIHRDCKSSNILITSKVVAKVGDFGLARVKHSTRSMIKSLVGTVCYQPPEMWCAKPKYDSKVDVFSAGLVFWEMLQWHQEKKKYPWEGDNEHAIYDAVGTRKLRPSVAGFRKQWGSDVVDLVERMWRQEPKERPTMLEVVADLEAMRAEAMRS